jgi:hypothetical protein
MSGHYAMNTGSEHYQIILLFNVISPTGIYRTLIMCIIIFYTLKS